MVNNIQTEVAAVRKKNPSAKSAICTLLQSYVPLVMSSAD